MAEQILSQEEIDSLLGAMSKGEVNLDSERRYNPEIESYDITSQSINQHDQFQVLEEIYDKFAALARIALTSTLQRNIGVEFISTEMMKFEKFSDNFSNPTDFTIFNMEPLIGSGLFTIEPELVFPLIDCMLGGDGKPLEKIRGEFTLIEKRMMRKFAIEVLQCLEKAWKFVYPIKFSFKKIETKPEFVHLFAPNDLVIDVLFSIKGQEFSGDIHLCISHLMLEPIKDKLSSKYLRERDRQNTWTNEIGSLLNQAIITISGELGRTTRKVEEILNLKIGDIISLNTGPQDPVILRIEDIPKYYGLLGAYKGNSSVRITNSILPDGG